MRPVFIGGCERSGTTMLGAMLGGHAECVCVPETQFIEQLLAAPDFDPDTVDTAKTLAKIRANERYRLLWDLPLERVAPAQDQTGPTYARLLSWLVGQYANRLGKPNPSVWVDQTPTNFRRALTLLRMFPDARFIHLVRDGRAVAASLLPLDWGPNNILHAAEFWMGRCALGLAAEVELGGARVQRVRYEDLVQDPERVLRGIAGFTGLEYQPAMAQGGGHRVGRYSQRQHRLVGQPPQKSRAEAWRRSLSRREIEIFEAEAGELLELLGYRTDFGIRARPARPPELLRMRLAELALRAGNNLRRRWRAHRSLRGMARH
jgi:Sulfotransferase family